VLDPDEDARYVLRISRCAQTDDFEGKVDDDRDYLEEIDDQLECAGSFDDEQLGGETNEPAEYDLCGECRQKFSLEPPEGRVVQSLDFSEN
jgi:hypothetical protein